MRDWTKTRVLILGAARQGVALARWLSRHGAAPVLSDSRPEEDLVLAKKALLGEKVRWALGGHPLELLDECDLLCLSGGVPLTLPVVREALRRGIPLSNDTQIFMEAVPCKTIGITGSAGKTTTTTLVGEMAKIETRDQTRAVFVGGNIGDPLINYADDMRADDLAILELSSFQLEQTTLSPNIAALLNLTPNHLDRHGTMEAYASAKARILDFQSAQDTAIIGRDDDGAWNLREHVRGALQAFSLRELDKGLNGACLRDGVLYLRENSADERLLAREEIHLRGEHNVANVLAAFAIGHAAGFHLDAMREATREFRGVPHRLEFVRELRGAKWYNDSIATAPERSLAALRSFDEPIVLLLGGRDKNLPWGALANLVRERVKFTATFGEAGGMIQEALIRLGGVRAAQIGRADSLKGAIQLAAQESSAGDVVLLSPGCTSYDEFVDFAERGAAFKKWTLELT
ncbi:MAG: UDP-N-acetylmuramoyl-L-alanine--D-glutamate ligase [Anaerolineales bacterium]|nr:UDP-N-acetylmuramoyl-L-alanine--D-glutamate ligase [Anaerolineales bacterium]